jgi:carboxypeptidase D
VPGVAYVKEFSNIFRFNQSAMARLEQIDRQCGGTKFLNTYLTFPPKGPMPVGPPTNNPSCGRLWRYLRMLASKTNACFNQYQITTTCPLLWDVLGFPGSFEYLPEGARIYFDREDVKKAINAPAQTWAECSDIPLQFSDKSEPSSYSVLPRVIEKSKRTIISHGTLDFILLGNGTLLSIQNMTWNGAQGFQTQPKTPFVIPAHDSTGLSSVQGTGTQGIVHEERGLTWVEVFLSGHMVPQYTPAVAFRQMEYLLGRIPSLSGDIPFTSGYSAPPKPWPFGGLLPGQKSLEAEQEMWDWDRIEAM